MKELVIIFSLFISGAVFAHEGENHSEKVIKVRIDDSGFKPSRIEAKKGENLVLLVTRTTDKTCTKELKNIGSEGTTQLPLNKEVRFRIGHLERTGEIKILCGMDMTAGVVKVL